MLLWGAGYGTDLRWFDAPAIASIGSVNELCGRCGCIFRSLDAPDLPLSRRRARRHRRRAVGPCWSRGRSCRTSAAPRGWTTCRRATRSTTSTWCATWRRDPRQLPAGARLGLPDALLDTPDDRPYPLLLDGRAALTSPLTRGQAATTTRYYGSPSPFATCRTRSTSSSRPSSPLPARRSRACCSWGAGPCQHMAELSRRGLRFEGLDINPAMLDYSGTRPRRRHRRHVPPAVDGRFQADPAGGLCLHCAGRPVRAIDGRAEVTPALRGRGPAPGRPVPAGLVRAVRARPDVQAEATAGRWRRRCPACPPMS